MPKNQEQFTPKQEKTPVANTKKTKRPLQHYWAWVFLVVVLFGSLGMISLLDYILEPQFENSATRIIFWFINIVGVLGVLFLMPTILIIIWVKRSAVQTAETRTTMRQQPLPFAVAGLINLIILYAADFSLLRRTFEHFIVWFIVAGILIIAYPMYLYLTRKICTIKINNQWETLLYFGFIIGTAIIALVDLYLIISGLTKLINRLL